MCNLIITSVAKILLMLCDMILTGFAVQDVLTGVVLIDDCCHIVFLNKKYFD